MMQEICWNSLRAVMLLVGMLAAPVIAVELSCWAAFKICLTHVYTVYMYTVTVVYTEVGSSLSHISIFLENELACNLFPCRNKF